MLFDGTFSHILPEWGLEPGSIRESLQGIPQLDHATLITAIFSTYARQQSKPRWGDKTPAYAESIGLLASIFPDAQIVHIIRDGRAVCESMLRQRFGPNDLLEAAHAWSNRVRRGHRAGQGLPAHHYLEVFYWQLVMEPERILRQVCLFLGLTFDPVMLQHHKVPVFIPPVEQDGRHTHALQPITPTLREAWKTRLTDPQRRTIEAVAGRTLQAFGYSVEWDMGHIPFLAQVLTWRARRFMARVPKKLTHWIRKYAADKPVIL